MSQMTLTGAGCPAGAAFDPLSLSPLLMVSADTGLFQELTGASATTPAVITGDPIGTWRDQSGNAHHLTIGANSNRPTLVKSIVNGRDVVRLDAVDDALQVAGITTANVFTAFLVMANNAGNGANSRQALFWGMNIGGMRIIAEGAANGSAGPAVSNATRIIRVERTAANTAAAYLNGSSSSFSSVAATPTAGTTTLGTGNTGSNGGACDLGAIIVYPYLLTTSQRTAVETYLNNLYGAF